jgi:hypothetical protein
MDESHLGDDVGAVLADHAIEDLLRRQTAGPAVERDWGAEEEAVLDPRDGPAHCGQHPRLCAEPGVRDRIDVAELALRLRDQPRLPLGRVLREGLRGALHDGRAVTAGAAEVHTPEAPAVAAGERERAGDQRGGGVCSANAATHHGRQDNPPR